MEGWKYRFTHEDSFELITDVHISVDLNRSQAKQLVLHLLDFYFLTSRALLISLEFPSFGEGGPSIRETKENHGSSKPLAPSPLHSKNGLNTARDSAFQHGVGFLHHHPPLPPHQRK